MLPLVGDFLAQYSSVFIVELLDLVNVRGALGDQSSLDKNRHHFPEVKLGGELLDILDQLLLGDANKWILDPMNGLSKATTEGARYVTDSPVTFSVKAAKSSFSRLLSTKTEPLRFCVVASGVGSATGSVAGL